MDCCGSFEDHGAERGGGTGDEMQSEKEKNPSEEELDVWKRVECCESCGMGR